MRHKVQLAMERLMGSMRSNIEDEGAGVLEVVPLVKVEAVVVLEDADSAAVLAVVVSEVVDVEVQGAEEATKSCLSRPHSLKE
jgi:hypothetical protein